jgi:alpha-L-rhamnosidase
VPRLRVALFFASILFAITPLRAADALLEGFLAPPQSSRPRVWWHWMNGNVTEAGIRADIDWMARIGIGGLQNFDAALSTPQIVPERVAYMTPRWQSLFRVAVQEANRRDLEFAIAASPGWSETGGPWVPPKDGMKKLVWSSVDVRGGRKIRVALPTPPTTNGPFQEMRSTEAFPGDSAKQLPDFYQDIRVLAVPVLAQKALPMPRISTRGTALDAALLMDERYDRTQAVAAGTEESPGSIELDYGAEVTVRSASIAIPDINGAFREAPVAPRLLERLADGSYREVARLPVDKGPQTTVTFPAVTAQHFRIEFIPKAERSAAQMLPGALGARRPPVLSGPNFSLLPLAELRLWSEPRAHRFEVKAGFGTELRYQDIKGGSVSESSVASPEKVRDLTALVNEAGELNWSAPPGQWRIVRLGYSLTGKLNHPATAEATGLEVDKYDARAVRDYLNHYLDQYAAITGPELFGKQGLRALLTDSIEVGASNWTPDFLSQFQTRRGYDATPWLPALVGIAVGSTAQRDGFLYDFRATLAELLTENHYGTIAKVARERGLTLYGEALEVGRPVLGDDMAMRRYTAVPMAALWTYAPTAGPRQEFIGDMRGAASVAHIYGQNITAAESMTSAFAPWAYSPADLQPIIDLEFAQGINRPVIHTSVHQPVDDKKPGLSLLIFGQHFNRHETWAESAKPWIDYIARSAHLLQQGRAYADVAYFHGEDTPLTVIYSAGAPTDLPRHHGFDFIDRHTLLHELTVQGGRLVARSGASWRVLQLGPESRLMTLPVLRRLSDLVAAGAAVIGPRPMRSPSLADDGQEFERLANALWPTKIVTTSDADAWLKNVGLAEDFAVLNAAVAQEVMFQHRRLDDSDIYFVSNRSARSGPFELAFGVTASAPERWRAETGERDPLTYRREGSRTVVTVPLEARGSAFIVFRGSAGPAQNVLPERSAETLLELNTDWQLSFIWGPAAPSPSITSVGDWRRNPLWQYFSGTGLYQREVRLTAQQLRQSALQLDLGAVGDIAKLRINGVDVSTLWKAPYRVDVTRYLRAGLNKLEVEVTNLWVNRLIGDAQPGAVPVTFTTLATYEPSAPLRASGLIGPVRLTRTTSRTP